jgi:hypothetical protein
MNLVLGLSAHTGGRLAEVGFLLDVFAGLWLAASQIPRFKLSAVRIVVAGLAFAVSGALLIVAVHWGHFG